MESKFKKELLPADQAWRSRRNYDRRIVYPQKAIKTEENVIRWLFALNTATLAGTLSYGAARGLNDYLVASLWASAAGIFTLLVRAVWEHYRVQDKRYDPSTSESEEFDAGAIRTKEIADRNLKRAEGSHFLHGLAALSAILFAIAFWAVLQGVKSIAIAEPPARW
jgi:hypothetical protein